MSTDYASMTLEEVALEMVKLTREKKKVEAELSPIKDRLAEVQAVVEQKLTTGMTDSIKVDGATVFMRRDLAVKHKLDPRHTAEKLLANNHADMLQASPQKLKAYLRELLVTPGTDSWEAENSRLPEFLKDAVEVSEFNRASVRGA